MRFSVTLRMVFQKLINSKTELNFNQECHVSCKKRFQKLTHLKVMFKRSGLNFQLFNQPITRLMHYELMLGGWGGVGCLWRGEVMHYHGGESKLYK